MEGGGDHQSLGNGGARWTPTKEQINMLEGLYKQGLRTPSADQIQQITTRLKEFGHIEGKNVFYWFQNHKARQRQKQKLENNSAYFGRLYHHSTTSAFAPYPPPHHNVVCAPCHIPPTQAELAMYHQHAKVQLPAAAAGGGFKRRLVSPAEQTSQRYNTMMQSPTSNKCEQETLELFPMHPTGILQAKNATLENQRKEDGKNDDDDDQPFYDFFSGKLN